MGSSELTDSLLLLSLELTELDDSLTSDSELSTGVTTFTFFYFLYYGINASINSSTFNLRSPSISYLRIMASRILSLG